MGGLSLGTATLGLGVVLVATIVATLAARSTLTRPGDSPGVDLTLYQIALLAGGRSRVSDTALSYLTWSGLIEVRESTDRLVRLVGADSVPDLHPVEMSVLNAIDAAGVRPESAMAAGRYRAGEEIGGLDGLVVPHAWQTWLGAITMIGCGAVLVATLIWLTSMETTGSGFLPLLALTAAVYAVWWFVGGRPRLTGTGHALLEEIRARFDSDLQIAAIGVTSLPLTRAMHVIALYGRDALTGGLSGLRKVMTGSPSPTLAMRSSLSR